MVEEDPVVEEPPPAKKPKLTVAAATAAIIGKMEEGAPAAKANPKKAAAHLGGRAEGSFRALG